MASGKTIADAAGEQVAIRSQAALDQAIAEIDSLLGRRSRTRAESKRLELLSDAVREYERGEMPVAKRSAADRLRTLLGLHEMDAKQLSEDGGVRLDAIEAILAGRGVSETNSTALARYFALDSSAFRS